MSLCSPHNAPTDGARAELLRREIARVDGQAPGTGLAKHHKMCTSPFVFYRGSSQLFYADWLAGNIALPSDAHTLPMTTVMGDCHISNFGFLTEEGAHGDTVIFAVNDFDDACIGHILWDLQRLASSMVLCADHVQGALSGHYDDPEVDLSSEVVSEVQVEQALQQLYSGYMAVLSESLSGQPQSQLVYSDFHTPSALIQLQKKANKRAFGGKHFLTKSTFAKAVDTRSLPLRFVRPHAKFADIPVDLANELKQAFAPYFHDAILDVVARLDAGTGSVNMARFYFLVGPNCADRDVAIAHSCVVEVKQQRPAAALYYFPDLDPQNLLNPAHLTAMCQRRMQRRPDLILDEAVWNDMHWLVRSRHHAKVGVDPVDICQGDINARQGGFAQYAKACGMALALGHLRGDRRSTYNEAKYLPFLQTHQLNLQQSAVCYAEQVKQDWQWLLSQEQQLSGKPHEYITQDLPHPL